ncbi:hypothetical protein ABBQ38_006227 [Trebouxia sp. C0009 RCD-2024]
MVVYEAHRPAIPEDCPEAFVRLMTACWGANPADRPSFEQITKELQGLYQESRKKPLQSASLAPTTLEQKVSDRRSTGPSPPSSGPLRVRPNTADISDLTPPETLTGTSTSSCPTVAAGASSPFANVAAPEQPSANGTFARDVPTPEEAKQRMAAEPTPSMPAASEVNGNASSCTSWRGPPASQQT